MHPVTLHLDRSGTPGGLYLERDGQRVGLEEAFEGFSVSKNDVPTILTMCKNFIDARDKFEK